MEADISVFVSIRRVDPRGVECWSSREFAEAMGYTDRRNFAAVLEKAKLACLNSGQTVEDHFVDITEMVEMIEHRSRSERVSLSNFVTTTAAIAPSEFLISRIIR